VRVLQFVHGYPPEFIAGTERYCEAVSQGLLKRGHECAILAGSDESAPAATLSGVEQGGLLVIRYLRVGRRPRRWTEEYDPAAEGLARHLLALLNPDVVHLHHWLRLTNNLVAICSDLAIPVVATLHDVWTSCPRVHRIRWDQAFCEEPPATAPCLTCAERGPWQRDLEIARALALRQEIMSSELALAAAIIAPSEAHSTFLRELHGLNGDRFIVLPHGSVPTIGSPRRKRTGPRYPARPLQIGHWGYLMYPKGTHLLLEAVHLLRDPSSVELHLVGTASEDYESRLRDLSKGISVRFHGAYQPQDLLTLDLDLAIFPSITFESYSFTLDEAVRLRLPVIVSDRGALPQRIGGAGLTFRAGNAADLAKQIQEILDAPDLLVRMRRNIRPGNLVSMAAHVAMLEKIYENVAHTRKRRRKFQTPYLKLVADGVSLRILV
jgi:glycosyltransferase involved in cell wall biosynthesis